MYTCSSEITTILTTSVERDELPNDEAIALEKQRKVLALEMTQLSEAIDAAIEENNESEKRTLVDRFRFEIWPQITRMSLEFFQNNPSRREHDVSIQNWLREQMATILYKAGYVKLIYLYQLLVNGLIDELILEHDIVNLPTKRTSKISACRTAQPELHATMTIYNCTTCLTIRAFVIANLWTVVNQTMGCFTQTLLETVMSKTHG